MPEFDGSGEFHDSPDMIPVFIGFKERAREWRAPHEHHLLGREREIDAYALRNDGDLASECPSIPPTNFGSTIKARTGIASPQTRHRAYQCRFARTVWPRQRHELTGIELAGQIVKNFF